MKKLTLKLEELSVVSFETAPSAREKVQRYEWAWSDDSVCPTITESGPRCRPY